MLPLDRDETAGAAEFYCVSQFASTRRSTKQRPTPSMRDQSVQILSSQGISRNCVRKIPDDCVPAQRLRRNRIGVSPSFEPTESDNHRRSRSQLVEPLAKRDENECCDRPKQQRQQEPVQTAAPLALSDSCVDQGQCEPADKVPSIDNHWHLILIRRRREVFRRSAGCRRGRPRRDGRRG